MGHIHDDALKLDNCHLGSLGDVGISPGLGNFLLMQVVLRALSLELRSSRRLLALEIQRLHVGWGVRKAQAWEFVIATARIVLSTVQGGNRHGTSCRARTATARAVLYQHKFRVKVDASIAFTRSCHRDRRWLHYLLRSCLLPHSEDNDASGETVLTFLNVGTVAAQ